MANVDRSLRQSAPGHWSIALSAGLGVAVLLALGFWAWKPPTRPAPVAATTAAPAAPASAAGPIGQPQTLTPFQERRVAAGSGRWSRLSAAEQTILAPLKDDWFDLTKDQRLKWFDLAQRFPSLQPDEQQRIQARMADWARMSSAERGAARLNFQEIRQLSARERMERWEAYQGLDAQERKHLAERGQATALTAPASRRSDNPSSPVPKSSEAVTEALAGVTPPARSVGATVVQAPLGATTVLVSRVPVAASPAAGPKIAATSDFVDRATLLPQPRPSRAAPAAETEPGAEPTDPPAEPPPAETPPTGGG